MGILNVTPDSFFDGGKYFNTKDAIERGVQMVDQGADIIDVGGESSRPFATRVETEVEIERVIPVIKGLKKAGIHSISIDTTKPEVAKKAVEAGAVIINDISASLSYVAADYKVGWVAMHMQGTPLTMQLNPKYENIVSDIKRFLIQVAEEATKIGVKEVWIDPGFGFGKTLNDNVELLNLIGEFTETNYQVMVGVSRKSFVGKISAPDVDLVSEALVETDKRKASSVALAMYVILQGVKMVRVHDVLETYQAIKLLDELDRIKQ